MDRYWKKCFRMVVLCYCHLVRQVAVKSHIRDLRGKKIFPFQFYSTKTDMVKKELSNPCKMLASCNPLPFRKIDNQILVKKTKLKHFLVFCAHLELHVIPNEHLGGLKSHWLSLPFFPFTLSFSSIHLRNAPTMKITHQRFKNPATTITADLQ